MIDKEKEKRIMQYLNEEKVKIKIRTEEGNEILDKARNVLENVTKERLNKYEEEILKQIAGVVYAAYKKYIEGLDKGERGGTENEPEL